MRYSEEKKFIFLANPKTGSTSIRSILNDISDHFELVEQGLFHEHWSAQEYRRIFENIGLKWESYYKFTTIRNPWEKYISNYFFSKPDGKFLPFYDEKYDESTSFRYSFQDWVNYYIRDQKRFPPGCPPLENFAYYNKRCLLDDIFSIEKFSKTALPLLINKGILDPEVTLPHLNKTRKRNYREYYNTGSAKLVADICSLDIELGGYVF